MQKYMGMMLKVVYIFTHMENSTFVWHLCIYIWVIETVENLVDRNSMPPTKQHGVRVQ